MKKLTLALFLLLAPAAWPQGRTVMFTGQGQAINPKSVNGVPKCDQSAGTTEGAQISACIGQLPAAGGIADAMGIVTGQTISADPFTAVTKNADVLLPAGTTSITTNLTIPANVRPHFMAGAIWNVATGVTVTFNGQIDATPNQHFIYTGTGKVVMAASQWVYPEWWGAVADGSTDVQAAFQKAANTGGNLWITLNPSAFTIKSAVTFTTSGQSVECQQPGTAPGGPTNISFANAATAVLFDFNNGVTGTAHVSLRNCYLDGGGDTTHTKTAVRISNVTDFIMSHVIIDHWTDGADGAVGIEIDGHQDTAILDTQVTNTDKPIQFGPGPGATQTGDYVTIQRANLVANDSNTPCIGAPSTVLTISRVTVDQTALVKCKWGVQLLLTAIVSNVSGFTFSNIRVEQNATAAGACFDLEGKSGGGVLTNVVFSGINCGATVNVGGIKLRSVSGVSIYGYDYGNGGAAGNAADFDTTVNNVSVNTATTAAGTWSDTGQALHRSGCWIDSGDIQHCYSQLFQTPLVSDNANYIFGSDNSTAGTNRFVNLIWKDFLGATFTGAMQFDRNNPGSNWFGDFGLYVSTAVSPVSTMAGLTKVFSITGNGQAAEFTGTLKGDGVINAVTGYEINGAAASNHILLGNGTNYVDATTLPTAALPVVPGANGGLGIATPAAITSSPMGAQSSASCTNITNMTWAIAASKNYTLKCEIPITFATSATVAFCLGGPGTPTSYSLEFFGLTGASAAFQDISLLANTTYGTKTTASGAPGAAEWVHVNATIQNGATASGTALTLQTAANGTNNITVGANASCTLTQVN